MLGKRAEAGGHCQLDELVITCKGKSVAVGLACQGRLSGTS